MCLAVPSKIVEIKDSVALVDVDGVTREASILLLDDVQVGDYVIVHAGFAISRIDAETAELTLKEMRQMLSFQDQGAVDYNSGQKNYHQRCGAGGGVPPFSVSDGSAVWIKGRGGQYLKRGDSFCGRPF
ncbi:MAG: HypC/HybG/HupF family hydrogenase formation chaperone [Thermodesulfobacteriota bacterium]|nr:HypC/HybG/HupF family hydrogenase formation chaperone [Thermodesulfobacteriota bacterium]